MIDRSMRFCDRLHVGVASVLLVAFISPSPELPVRAEFTGQAQSYAWHEPNGFTGGYPEPDADS